VDRRATKLVDNLSDATAVKRRRKLSEGLIPSFDDKFEEWLSFKNAFISMIRSQTDLSDSDKLHYLITALKDEAVNKIKIFSNDSIDYLLRGNC